MNVQQAVMVAIVMPLVTLLKAHIFVSANPVFMETEETAARVIHYHLVVTLRCLFQKNNIR